MFIGREKELSILNKYAKSNSFEFGIVYGRRRIGKTSLLIEMLNHCDGIYFVASETGFENNFNKLSILVANYFNESISFDSLDMMFKYIAEKSRKKRVVLIIDEFTYLLSKDNGVESLFQNAIDKSLLKSNVLLILSGSQVGMISEVLSYKKPLYGRKTFQIELKSFNYFESSKFYINKSNIEKIYLYSIFGGIPYYLSKINNKDSLKEIIINLIIGEGALLANETEFFLRQELRSVETYSKIINAVASGNTRLSSISDKSQMKNTGTTSKYLKTLIDLDIIKKEYCFGEKSNSKKTLYILKDNFFKFYYKFIVPNKSKMTILDVNVFYDIFVKDKLDDYVSYIFEDICTEYLILNNKLNTKDPFFEIGRYWGNSKKLKRQVEIDIVTRENSNTTVYECKWTNKKFTNKETTDLINESSDIKANIFGGFSKNGFTDESLNMLKYAYTVDDLYKA